MPTRTSGEINWFTLARLIFIDWPIWAAPITLYFLSKASNSSCLGVIATRASLNEPSFIRPWTVFPIFQVSLETNYWGLLMDKSRVCQPQRIQLVIAFHRRRYGKLEASLDQPLPEIKQPDPPINVISQSLWVKDFMAAHPDETCLSAASKLNLPRKRISKLLTIANHLPSNVITELANCNDPKVLPQMSVKHLLHLTKMYL